MREFHEGLTKALDEQVSGSILGLGPLTKSNEYYVALNNRETRDRLILCGVVTVKDQQFKVRSKDSTRFT